MAPWRCQDPCNAMMRHAPSIALLMLVSSVACVVAEDEGVPRAMPVAPMFTGLVTSESGQFRVRGGEPALRGSIAILAEQTRTEFLKLTGETRAEPKTPVNIHLMEPPPESQPANAVATTITYNDHGYELRIMINTRQGLDMERFRGVVTSALIYERSLAGLAPGEVDTPLLVQPWLVEGLLEANRWRNDLSDRRLYEALFLSGGLFDPDEMFIMPESIFQSLDAASRAAFRVSSGAFVMALIEQPNGMAAFRKFLAEVARFSGEMPTLLRRHFPELNLSENSMAKWWALQLAQKSDARLTESLTILETEKALARALTFHFRDGEGNLREESLDAWTDLLELDMVERGAAIRIAAEALVRLSYRCFPSYRPILSSYQDTLILIQQEKPPVDTIARRIGELEETRGNIIAKAGRARDYMDWFEITRARETSGAFDDYLRVKRQLRENPRLQRHDPLSSMLDRFDSIFHREEASGQHALQWNW